MPAEHCKSPAVRENIFSVFDEPGTSDQLKTPIICNALELSIENFNSS